MELISSADYYDDYYYDDYDDYYYDDDDDDDDDDYYQPTSYVTNDGLVVSVVGFESYSVDLSSGYYGTAVNINAMYSYGSNVLYGNYMPNAIFAGAGATTLWGGQDYSNDVLVGGWNYDTFYCGKSEGSDNVLNAASIDTVRLYDVSLSDIVATAYDGVSIGLLYNTGNITMVACTDYVSPTFVLSDGSRYTFNRVTCSWQ